MSGIVNDLDAEITGTGNGRFKLPVVINVTIVDTLQRYRGFKIVCIDEFGNQHDTLLPVFGSSWAADLLVQFFGISKRPVHH